jgi:hypothetical protein
MCLCCSAKAKTIRKDILPGYNLLKGTVNCPEWPRGYYALQKWNDPDFIWKQKVECEPRGNFDEDPEAFKKWGEWARDAEEMEKSFKTDPQTGYELYKACLRAGYRPKRDGFRILFWLRDHLAKKLKQRVSSGEKK